MSTKACDLGRCPACGAPLFLMNFDDDTELEYCDECGEVA